MEREIKEKSCTNSLIKNTFLLCINCKNHIPSLKLKQVEEIICADIKCKHCKYKNTILIEDYMTLMEKLEIKSNNSQNTLSPVIYCVKCAKWLNEESTQDHMLYPQLSNHLKINCEVIFKNQCLKHKGNYFENYCNDCEESLCKDCIVIHTKKNHSIITKEELRETIEQLDIVNINEKMKRIKEKNKEIKDDCIEQLENKIKHYEKLKNQIQLSYEENAKTNARIEQFIKATLLNYNLFKKRSSFELMNNVMHLFDINDNKPTLMNKLFLEKNCIILIKYFKTNYLIKSQDQNLSSNENSNEEGDEYNEYQMTDGREYKGYFKKSKPHGYGKMIYPNGNSYEGDWIEDKYEGFGEYRWENGSQYKGYFKNNKREGKGKMVYSNKNCYDGQWADDQYEGEGIFYCNDGTEYKGKFRRQRNISCNELLFQKECSENQLKLIGYGEIKYIDYKIYKGYFLDGKPHGQGIMIFPNKDVYNGEWVDGYFEGVGVYKWFKGNQYKGNYKKQMRQGHGVMLYSNGNVYIGEWINDIKVGIEMFKSIDMKVNGEMINKH